MRTVNHVQLANANKEKYVFYYSELRLRILKHVKWSNFWNTY